MVRGLLSVVFGLVLAVLVAAAAGVVSGLPLLQSIPGLEAPIVRLAKSAWPMLQFVWPLALAAIAAAELRRWRSWDYWGLVGVAIGICGYGAYRSLGTDAAPAIMAGRAPVSFAVMGLLGGLAYWWIAGRKAGALSEAFQQFFGPGQSSDTGDRRRCALCASVGLLLGLIPLALLGWHAFHKSNPPIAKVVSAKAEADADRMLKEAGLASLKFSIDARPDHGHIGHVSGSVVDYAAKIRAFDQARTILSPIVGMPGIVAVLQNNILAVDESDPQVAAENTRIRKAQEAARSLAAEAAEMRKVEVERRAVEAEAKRKADEETAKKKAEDEARLAAEAEGKRKADEETATKKAEDEARLAAEAEGKRKADEETAKKKAEDEARLAAEAEGKRKADEETAKKKAEDEARLAAEAEAKRKADEETAKKKAEDEARLAAEAEGKRKADEETAKKKAEDEARLAAEAEGKRKADEETAKKKAEDEARLAAEAEGKRKADEETATKKAEDEARLAAEAEAKRKADQDDASRSGTTWPTSRGMDDVTIARVNCVGEYGQLFASEALRFALKSAALESQHGPFLDKLGNLAKRCDGIGILIEGNSDSWGAEEFNQALSEQRAEAVRAALVERGVSSKQLATRGFGELKPLRTERTREADAANRRVDFGVIEIEKIPQTIVPKDASPSNN